MTCNCKAEIPFNAITSRDELAAAQELCQSYVSKGLWELTRAFKEKGFTSQWYTCKVCNETFILSFVTKGFRGYMGVQLKPVVYDDTYSITSIPLKKLLDYLLELKINIAYKGANYYDNSKPGQWIGFDCYYNEEFIRKKFGFTTNIEYWEYNGMAMGQESGFRDIETGDAILGWHPMFASSHGNIPCIG